MENLAELVIINLTLNMMFSVVADEYLSHFLRLRHPLVTARSYHLLLTVIRKK